MKGFSAVFENLERVTDAMLDTAEQVAQETAADMELYAKENRRWQDRTGDARKGLVGKSARTENEITASIHQDLYGQTGKEYGYWLENAHGKKYAILEETRNKHASDFFDGIAQATGEEIRRAGL